MKLPILLAAALLASAALAALVAGCGSDKKPPDATGPRVDLTLDRFAKVRSLLDTYHARYGKWPDGPTSYEVADQLKATGLLTPQLKADLVNDAGQIVDGWDMEIGYYTGGSLAHPNLKKHYESLAEQVPMLVSAGPDRKFGTDDDLFDPK
ncbi:MAG: hypothetical protein BIFFINMI_00980 [Phycisphaerae bacterium]|nr:hypothetical protein [Phycisphaerae bacterium]